VVVVVAADAVVMMLFPEMIWFDAER